MSYEELLDDLKRCVASPATLAKARAAIEELLTLHQLDQAEIVRLRRQIEVLQMGEGEKLEDLREGNRSPYRRDNG